MGRKISAVKNLELSKPSWLDMNWLLDMSWLADESYVGISDQKIPLRMTERQWDTLSNLQ